MTHMSNEEMMDKMLGVDGEEFTFIVERPTEVIARDGLEATISTDALELMVHQIRIWIGTRLMRKYEETGIGPQRIEVTVSVKV